MLLPSGVIGLDYRDAVGLPKLLRNLSGIAVDGDRAWTVSDEGRSFECLVRTETGFVLQKQYGLDDFFPDLPEGHEADLESLDVVDGHLWLAGSHGRVRHQPDPDKAGKLKAELRDRPSRHLLGAIALGDDGLPLAGTAARLPFTGSGSLRRILAGNTFLEPFMALASKENGLDIEGLAVLPDRLLLGLRGPVLDSHAIVVELPRGSRHPVKDGAEPVLHVLDLGGLGVRDLARDGERILVIAGPTTAADGPFRLHEWHPVAGGAIETPAIVYVWPGGAEHPEGICPFARGGKPGFLVVYDTPGEGRIAGSTVTADWLAAPQ